MKPLLIHNFSAYERTEQVKYSIKFAGGGVRYMK